MPEDRTLSELQAEFRAGGTNAMPIAGMIVWAALGIGALFLAPGLIANLSIYILPAILPLAFLIDKLRGRNMFAGGDDPLSKLFFLSIVMIGLSVPLVIIGAQGGQALLMLLGMAIFAGLIWIPYGWAADDRSGIVHAVARALGAYAAYALVPAPFTATAICAVVVAAYAYSLAMMRPVGPGALRPA